MASLTRWTSQPCWRGGQGKGVGPATARSAEDPAGRSPSTRFPSCPERAPAPYLQAVGAWLRRRRRRLVRLEEDLLAPPEELDPEPPSSSPPARTSNRGHGMDHHYPTPIFPASSSPRSQSKAVAPEASPERSCSLHSCPLEDPSSSSGPPPATSTLQPVGPSSPLAPAHFTYPRVQQEYRGGSSLPGLGDRAGLCSHGCSLSPSPAPSQRDGTWKPASVQHHVVSVR